MSKPKIIVWKNETKVKQINLVEKALTIGRGGDNKLCLKDGSVSTHHAEIRRGFLGYTLIDLDSSNGTRLNGRPIDHKTKLHAGDHINVGPFSIHFDPKRKEGFEALAKRASRTMILTCVSGPDKGLEMRDNLAKIRIGAGKSCDLVLKKHPKIGDAHASILFEGSRFYLKATKAIGHTYLNKLPVTRHVIADGDFVRFGDSVFTYHELN